MDCFVSLFSITLPASMSLWYVWWAKNFHLCESEVTDNLTWTSCLSSWYGHSSILYQFWRFEIRCVNWFYNVFKKISLELIDKYILNMFGLFHSCFTCTSSFSFAGFGTSWACEVLFGLILTNFLANSF